MILRPFWKAFASTVTIAMLGAAFTWVPVQQASAARYRLTLPGTLSYELMLPSLVAYSEGYFSDEGVELAEFVVGSSAPLRAALIAGQYEFGLFGFVHVPLLRLANAPWKAVLATHEREIFNLVVRSALKREVKTVADLRGRTVGFDTPGSASWYMGSAYLKKAGLDPQRDVNYVAVGADATVLYSALQTGRIDAFPTWEPTTTRVIEDGIAYPVTRIWERDEHLRWLGSEKALSLVLIAREDLIRQRPDVVQAVVDAHKRALDFIRTRSSREIARSVLNNPKTRPMFAGLSQDLVVKMLDRIKPGFGNGCLSRSGFEVEMDLATEYKMVQRPITFEEFADTSFAGECS